MTTGLLKYMEYHIYDIPYVKRALESLEGKRMNSCFGIRFFTACCSLKTPVKQSFRLMFRTLILGVLLSGFPH
jgi:hypothetical protein